MLNSITKKIEKLLQKKMFFFPIANKNLDNSKTNKIFPTKYKNHNPSTKELHWLCNAKKLLIIIRSVQIVARLSVDLIRLS